MSKEKIEIITPQFERAEKLDYETPKTEDEFYGIVKNAPWGTLFGYGFRKWSTMNDCIWDNVANEDKPTIISLPTYNIDEAADAIVGALDGNPKEPSGSMLYDLGCRQPLPKQKLEIDEDIILFPGEWYDIIPNGFIVTGLHGESYPFEKGKSDDDIRFGCLPYGIRKQVKPKNNQP